MFKKRYFKKEDMKAIIDMDDFLVTYAATVLGEGDPNLSQKVYRAGSNNLQGLDRLFHDNGFGRIHKYVEVAQGFVSDLYNNLDKQAARAKVHSIIHQAMAYLGAHAKEFNHWKLA